MTLHDMWTVAIAPFLTWPGVVFAPIMFAIYIFMGAFVLAMLWCSWLIVALWIYAPLRWAFKR